MASQCIKLKSRSEKICGSSLVTTEPLSDEHRPGDCARPYDHNYITYFDNTAFHVSLFIILYFTLNFCPADFLSDCLQRAMLPAV